MTVRPASLENALALHRLNCVDCPSTAWDSEIESLTSLDASLIELDRRKRRHRVSVALAPSKSCLLPCDANLHASSASLKHGLPPPSFFRMTQLSSSWARRDHSCDR